jgi:serine/threonine-protein kinase
MGIVHRDIKPANIIILNDDGQVKVADFGIARLDTTSFTQTGMAVGTPSYMSPEQFKGTEVDRRSDLYSVSVVLFELLTGRRPFSGSTAVELMYQVLNEQPPRVRELNPVVPAALDAVIAKALTRDLADRFDSAAAFAKALRDALPKPAAVDDPTLLRTRLAVAPQVREGASPALGWTPEVLQKVEQSLATHIGPLAKVMVKRATQRAKSLEDLCQSLAESIPDAGEKSQFLRRIGTEVSGSAAMGSTPQAVASGLEPAVLALAQQALALVLGPIARHLVKKTAAQAISVADLYQRLAQHIPNAQERAAFLRRIPRAGR